MIDTLRYWCHKILPLVYDDSLSYYEVLCKTSAKLNEVIDSTNGLLGTWNEYKNDIDTAFGNYKKDIQDEFDKLSSAIGTEFTAYKTSLDRQIADAFATQDAKLTAQDAKLTAQDAKLGEMQTNINDFISHYNDVVDNIPSMVVDAVNKWMANTTNYDNVIAALAGSIQGLKHFDTVLSLISSRYADISPGEICVCVNYYRGDGVFTIWEIQEKDNTKTPDTFGSYDLRYTETPDSTDLAQRTAVLRSPYTLSTLGIATAVSPSERAIELCKFADTYSPIIIDRDVTLALSAENTTGKTLQLIGDTHKRPSVTLTSDNHFIDRFDGIKVIHAKSTITHNTGSAIHFDNSCVCGGTTRVVVLPNLDINNCNLDVGQIKCDASIVTDVYSFCNNNWTAAGITGIVVPSTAQLVPRLILNGNFLQANTNARTRLINMSGLFAMDTTIINNTIRNSTVGTNSLNANCVIADIISMSILDARVRISNNYFETTTETSGIRIGTSNDPVPRSVFYVNNNTARINTGSTNAPKYHTVNVTKINTYGALYPYIIGDIAYYPYAVIPDTRISDTQVGVYTSVPFSNTATVGYALNADGAIPLANKNANYRVEYAINVTSSTLQTVTVILGGQIVMISPPGGGTMGTASGVLYVNDNTLGGQPFDMQVHTTDDLSSISGTVRLFRLS